MANKKKKELSRKRKCDLERRRRRSPNSREIPKAPTSRLDMLEAFRKFGLDEVLGMASCKVPGHSHWSEYPDVVLASLMFVKAQFALDLTRKNGESSSQSLEDACLYLMNYASCLYGKIKSRSVR